MTYLHYFAKEENEEVCVLLLKYGADPDAKCGRGRWNYGNKTGVTPIHVWPELEKIIKRGPHAIAKAGALALRNKTHSDVSFFILE
jgi:hypothetical protein